MQKNKLHHQILTPYVFFRATRVSLASFNYSLWLTKYVGGSWWVFSTISHVIANSSRPTQITCTIISSLLTRTNRTNGPHCTPPLVFESRQYLLKFRGGFQHLVRVRPRPCYVLCAAYTFVHSPVTISSTA